MFRAFPKFIVRLACLAGLTHAGFSAFLAIVAEEGFSGRMLNVRAFEPDNKESRYQLIASFLEAARQDERPSIGFFGSSFTYGYPFPPSAQLVGATAEAFPDHRVVNVSVLGAGLDGIRTSLEMASLKGCRFETIVIEIPVVNETSFLHNDPRGWRRSFAELPEQLAHSKESTLFWWFFRRPSGVRYLALMFEELTLANDEIPLQLVQPYDGYFATADQFAAMRGEYVDKIRAVLEKASTLGDRVVAFPTPVFLAGEDRIRYDVKALREQIEVTADACRMVPGVTTVTFDERVFCDEKLYCNVTHLGIHGNRELGAQLARAIRESKEKRLELAAKPSDKKASR